MPTPKAGSGFVWINQTRLLTKIKALEKFEKCLSRDLDVSAAIRGMSSEWGRNFGSEGRRMMGGTGWKRLAKRTKWERKKRGYNPDRPILMQSGGLFRAAIEHPSGFKAKSMSRVVPGSGFKWSGGPTSIRITTSRNRGRMVLSGDKVVNNHGGKQPWGPPIPARPFWYVNKRVEEAGSEQLRKTLDDDVNNLDKA